MAIGTEKLFISSMYAYIYIHTVYMRAYGDIFCRHSKSLDVVW